MGAACVKGPRSAGVQKPRATAETTQESARKSLEFQIPVGPDSATLPEAKDSYDSAQVQAPLYLAQAADPAHPIEVTASATGRLSTTPPATFPALPSSTASSSAEVPGSKALSGDSSYSEAETDASTISNVPLLRNYTQLAELLHFSPYPLLLIDIEVEAQPIVFVNQVIPVRKLSTVEASVAEQTRARAIPDIYLMQALLKILHLEDDDLLEKPW